jgi:hypothetical protein
MFFKKVRPPMAFLLPLRPRDYGRCPWQLMAHATSPDGSCERAQSANALPATNRSLLLPRCAVQYASPIRRIEAVASLDHLVGGGQQRFWDDEAECLSGLEIDQEFEFRRLDHR